MRVLQVQAHAVHQHGTAQRGAAQDSRGVVPLSRRQLMQGLMLSVGALAASPAPSTAVGIESIEFPSLPKEPQFLQDLKSSNQASLDAAEESFQNSELLRWVGASTIQ